MTQYQIQNAVFKIDGYHLPRALEPLQQSFDRAKAETIQQLKEDLSHVENITLGQFASTTKKGTDEK